MILVTGATGMVGGHLLWHLLQKHEKVVAIHRSTANLQYTEKIFSFYTDQPAYYLSKIEWRIADILDLTSLMQVSTDIDVIYHCAAVVSLGGKQNNILDINVEGTRNMVEMALSRKVKQFCFVSSIASCGNGNTDSPVDENTTATNISNRSMYAQSKYFSEKIVLDAVSHGLNAVVVNPGVILGFTGVPTGSAQLFYRVKKGLPFYTPGGTGYVDVQDVVAIMIRLMEMGCYGEKFILVAENNSNREILNFMADGFEKKRPFIFINKQMMLLIGFLSEIFSKITGKQTMIDRGTAKSAVHRTWYNNDKIRNRLNFTFKPVNLTVTEICSAINKNSSKM